MFVKHKTKIIQFILLLISLIHAGWLVLIPGEGSQGFLFSLSLQRFLLLLVILVPCFLMVFSLTEFGKRILLFIYPLKKLLPYVASLVFLGSFFFLLMPFARLRISLPAAVWQRLLPLVSCYFWLAVGWMAVLVFEQTDPKKDQPVSKREQYIDAARGFAIVLAVGSHIFYAFGYDTLFAQNQYWVKSITRFATPTFVLITGIMFELVYYRKALKNGFKPTIKSLLKRAFQCYLAYLGTVLIEWFAYHLDSGEAFRASLFIGKSLFSGILKFYALFLLLAVLLIWLRKRFGIWVISLIPIVVWAGDLVLQRLVWPADGQPLSYLSALIFGYPRVSSFSVWHAMTFMAYGFILGYFLQAAKRTKSWKKFHLTLLILFLINAFVTIVFSWGDSLQTTLVNFAETYRTHHHIVYYSVGSMGALILLFLFWLLRNHLNHALIENTMTTLGKNSLWAFAVGNSLAAVLPVVNDKPLTVFIFFIAVLGGTILVIHAKKFISSLPNAPLLYDQLNQ